MRRPQLTVLSFSVMTGLLFGVACGTGGGGGGSSSGSPQLDAYIAKLQGCGLLSQGRLPEQFEPSPIADCFYECQLDASCEELEEIVCSDNPELDPMGILAQCVDACFSLEFTCANGETVPLDFECDGEADCSDGSDELNCTNTEFTCGDGTTVPGYFECDGFADCEDGSDEASCPVFTCGDGSTIPAEWECDFEEDCPNGLDESGCAELLCPDPAAP